MILALLAILLACATFGLFGWTGVRRILGHYDVKPDYEAVKNMTADEWYEAGCPPWRDEPVYQFTVTRPDGSGV